MENQKKFLEAFKAHKKFESWKELSKFLGINYRTFFHYTKERYLLPEKVFLEAKLSGMDVSNFKFEKFEDNWGARKSCLKTQRNWIKNFGSKGGKARTEKLPKDLRLEISRRGGINAREKKVGIHDPRFGENRFPGPFDIKYRSNIEVKVARLLEANGISFQYEKPFAAGSKRILIDFYLPEKNFLIEIEGFGFDEYLDRNFKRYSLLEGIPVFVFTKHITKTKKHFESLKNVSVFSMSELENFIVSISPMQTDRKSVV